MFDAVTVGANVLVVNVAVSGVTVCGLLAVTVGANVVIVRTAISGVTF